MDNITVEVSARCTDASSLVVADLALKQKEISWSASLQPVASSSDFFINRGSKSCAISKCALKEVGCRYVLSIPTISMTKQPPFSILVASKVEGFSHLICVECTNGAQTLVFDNFNITQPSKCLDTLSNNPQSKTELIREYKESIEPEAIIEQTKTYFINSNEDECPISKCELRAKGCIDGYESSKLSIMAAPPFSVKSTLNFVDGFTHEVCLLCKNLAETSTFDGVVVKQTSKCSTAMKKIETETVRVYKYDAVKKTQNVDVKGWSGFFDNSYPDTCLLQSCELKTAGCKEDYSGPHLSMTSSIPYAISAQVDYVNGN